jgi:hypothetical protein
MNPGGLALVKLLSVGSWFDPLTPLQDAEGCFNGLKATGGRVHEVLIV